MDFSARLLTWIDQYSIDQDMLCHSTNAEDSHRLVVPHSEELKYRTLEEAHDTALSGHLGREKIDGSVNQTYW